jgi:hypothetical protein
MNKQTTLKTAESNTPITTPLLSRAERQIVDVIKVDVRIGSDGAVDYTDSCDKSVLLHIPATAFYMSCVRWRAT